MKRILPLLLAALLAIGAAGCRASDPKENKIVLGDIANVPTDPANEPTSQGRAPRDCRIGPKILTSGEEYLIDLVTSDSVSLFSYTAPPEWRNVSVWVEPYFKGIQQPSIELGGLTYDPGDAVEGDLTIKIINPPNGAPVSYMSEVKFANDGAFYTKPQGDAIAMNTGGAHAIQTLTEPIEILEDQEIILRADSYNENTVYTPFFENQLDMERVKMMDYVFVYKCKFSRVDS